MEDGWARSADLRLMPVEVFAQCGIDPRLPAWAGGAKALDDVGVQAQRDQFLRGFGFWAAPASGGTNHGIADREFGLVEPLIGQFRDVLVFLGLDDMSIEPSQGAVNN